MLPVTPLEKGLGAELWSQGPLGCSVWGGALHVPWDEGEQQKLPESLELLRSKRLGWSQEVQSQPQGSVVRRGPGSSCLGQAGLAWAGEGQWVIVSSGEEARQ